jgi:hypothetical protein
MTYPMARMVVGDVEAMPYVNKGDAKRTSRNVSQYSIRHGKCFKCRTDVVKGLTFITRLG